MLPSAGAAGGSRRDAEAAAAGDEEAEPEAVLDRGAARGAAGVAADAAEWEARAAVLAAQREAAQREKMRRRADAARADALASRQMARVAEVRAASAAAVSGDASRDALRTAVRAQLSRATTHCATLGALLATLGVPPAGWPLPAPAAVAAAYRSAALRFHPDRVRQQSGAGGASDPAAGALYAEEVFKLIAKTKQEKGVS